MFEPDQYELLDFGDGRKLERFGSWIIDRPAPVAASASVTTPDAWRSAHARFDRLTEQQGRWNGRDRLPTCWTVRHGAVHFLLRPTPFGQVGLFPEQAENWEWIGRQVGRAGRPLQILNLFAYTGGSTLAAAAAGAGVTHIDAARNVVQWARDNAHASQLDDAPIRWIAEDARKFAQRESRRGRSYDAVILDPPSYGHGPKSEVWKLEEHLPQLLETCARLTLDRLAFLLLTCHTPGFGPRQLRTLLGTTLHIPRGQITAYPLKLTTRDGRSLDSGVVARWSALD